MKILILEDSIERIKKFSKKFIGHELFIRNNVKDAIKTFREEKGVFDFIFLDHDLDDKIMINSKEENTGYQFAKYLNEKDLSKISIIIHSVNPIGANNIYDILKTNKTKEIHKIPFIVLFNFVKIK